jgi:hypothetical protein
MHCFVPNSLEFRAWGLDRFFHNIRDVSFEMSMTLRFISPRNVGDVLVRARSQYRKQIGSAWAVAWVVRDP